MNKLLLIMLIAFTFIFSLSPTLSQEVSIGDNFHIRDNVTLIQNCDCDEVIFTKVINPNGEIIASNLMAFQDNTFFNYTLDGQLITEFGEYIVNGQGNLTSGEIQTFAYTFEVSKAENRTFSFDYKSTESIIGLILLLIVSFILIWLSLYMFAGAMVFMSGLFLFYNGAEWFIFLPLTLLGLILIGVQPVKNKGGSNG